VIPCVSTPNFCNPSGSGEKEGVENAVGPGVTRDRLCFHRRAGNRRR
jgi:hypothetical protein